MSDCDCDRCVRAQAVAAGMDLRAPFAPLVLEVDEIFRLDEDGELPSDQEGE